MYTKDQQDLMLKLARNTIKNRLLNTSDPDWDKWVQDSEITANRSVFITLTIKGRLRGCIGHIEPIQPLYLDIIENSLSAAFEDPRFDPLSKAELNEIKIEISILTVPKTIHYDSSADLLTKLKPLTDGVIIKKGHHQATYLPQVWKELSHKEAFLSNLCIKAGLTAEEWKKGDLEVLTYQVEKFEEK